MRNSCLEVICKHNNPYQAVTALIDLKTTSLSLYWDNKTLRQTILTHPNLLAYSGALKHLHQTNLLNHKHTALIIARALAQSSKPYAGAKALIRVKQTGLLYTDFKNVFVTALASSEKPSILAIALEDLYHAGLLNGDKATMILNAVIKHQNPLNLVEAIKKLQPISQKTTQSIIDLLGAMMHFPRPILLAEAFKKLDETGLLAGAEANLNFQAILQHQKPQEVALALCRLSRTGILNSINRQIILRHDEPFTAGYGLVLGHRAGLFNGEKGISNQKAILKHDNIDAVIEALVILGTKGLLNGEELQSHYDLLILPHASLLFGDETLQKLWHQLPTRGLTQEDIQEILQHAISYDIKKATIQKLLSCTTILAYADSQVLFAQEIKDYIDQYITDLMDNRDWQLTGREIPHIFCIIKHLIRRNEQSANRIVNRLLEHAVLQTYLNTTYIDEILDLALEVENHDIASFVFDIPLLHPPVNRMATGHLGLQTVIDDKESSMVALNAAEQSMVDRVFSHYHNSLSQTGGTQQVLVQLRQFLKDRYHQNPATCMVGDHQVQLPLSWEAFNQTIHHDIMLGHLDGKAWHIALKAYYQHPVHTAFRLLSKPNPWMAKDAKYVCGQPEAGKGYAYFEPYGEMISLFWLAVCDKEIGLTDNFTVKDRQEHFIYSLADIGRAHNWDDVYTNAFKEQDDLTGDRPSCYSGIKRRLFQSVIGHPFFKCLTKELVSQELNAFVYQYYTKIITEENCKPIREELNRRIFLEEPSENNAFDLKAINIDENAQKHFLTQLEETYGMQAKLFQYQVKLFFNPKPCDSHIEKYYQQIHHLLTNPLESAKVLPFNGFFTQTKPPDQVLNDHKTANNLSFQ